MNDTSRTESESDVLGTFIFGFSTFHSNIGNREFPPRTEQSFKYWTYVRHGIERARQRRTNILSKDGENVTYLREGERVSSPSDTEERV